MPIPFDLGFRGAGRPERDPRVEAVAATLWKDTLEQQGRVGFAGDDDNPRELPRRTLFSMRESMQDALDALKDDGTRLASLGLQIAFCDEAVTMPAPEVIHVPREDLWWLAAPGDLLLLSDGLTVHFTTMLHASEEKGRMQIVDEWPDRVFLREGFNEADVAARVQPFFAGVFELVLPGKQEIDLTREEFLRVAVGLVTLDTPVLFERLLDRRPALYRAAAVQMAIGRALMAPSHDVLARFAAPYFVRAEASAAHGGQSDHAAEAAAWSYAAHSIARLLQLDGVDAGATLPFAGELAGLHRRHGATALLARLDVEVLIRMGNAAAHAQQFDAAMAWLDLAIERNPFHDAAHWLRAKVRQFRNQPAEQVVDATEALARNQAWIERRSAKHNARDPRDHYGRKDDLGRIAGLRGRRADELLVRAQGLATLGRLDDAQTDLLEAQRLRPEDSEPRRLLEVLDRLRAAPAQASRG